MQTKFDALVHADIQGRPVWQCSIAAEEAALTKALALQAFGLAAGHVSSGKAELHQMSCMRWSSQGTREVAMISLKASPPSSSRRRVRAMAPSPVTA